MATSPSDAPSHILILGSGVFALTTLYELLQRARYSKTKFTLVSPTLPSTPSTDSSPRSSPKQDSTTNFNTALQASQTASHDINRIIRADYSDPAYAALAREAQALWRSPTAGWGANGRYNEVGLLLCAATDEDDSNPSTIAATKATKGSEYFQKALENARAQEPLLEPASTPAQRIRELPDAGAIESAMRAPGAASGTGTRGYANPRSGWADASASMDWLYERIVERAGGHVEFVRGEATRLLLAESDGSGSGEGEGGNRIAGARVSLFPTSSTTTATTETQRETREIHAPLTILATGAHTPSLLSLTGIASPRAHSCLYIPLSSAEATALQEIPVHMHLGSGCFLFPPTLTRPDTSSSTGKSWELKIARHAHGYIGLPRRVRPIRIDRDSEAVHAVTSTSLPSFPSHIPPKDKRLLLQFAHDALPALSSPSSVPLQQRDVRARICWYLDTASGDFIVSVHPRLRGLFVATGGSGHGFKFLPVLGRRIVDVLDGKGDGDGETRTWREKWRWPQTQEEGDGDGEVWCADGSRAGVPGLRLEEALAETDDDTGADTGNARSSKL